MTKSIAPEFSSYEREKPQLGILAIFTVLFFLAPIAYAFCTQHVWEDFYITFRHSQNLVEGRGLVFNPGERVHGFTSPIGVLLPALCYRLTGSHSVEATLWAFRVLSAIAFAAAGLLLLLTVDDGGPRRNLTRVFVGLLYLLEAKSVSYSANGMETAFVLMLLAWQLWIWEKNGFRDWLSAGVCWAGLMWARPDGFIFFGVISLAYLLTSAREQRPALIGAMFKAALVCTVLYLPWFAWAWSYYGSPVPNTIRAKAHVGSGILAQAKHMWRSARQLPAIVSLIYGPVYGGNEQHWYPGLYGLTSVLGGFCTIFWVLPVKDRLSRVASFGIFVMVFYLSYMITAFPWYFAPATLFGSIVLGRGVLSLADQLRARWPALPKIAVAALSVLCVERAMMLGLTTYEMRIQQKEIETGNRMRIGLWLKEHMAPNETVMMEPIGYIGYFSGAHVLDFPGLVTPKIIKARRDKHLMSIMELLPDIQPDWVIVRPREIRDSGASAEYFKTHYRLVETFDVQSNVEAYAFLPGRDYLMGDAVFKVFKRVDTPSDPETAAAATGR